MNVLLDCRAPMSGGVELSSDGYLPDGAGRWPVKLIRTPFHRVTTSIYAYRFARASRRFTVPYSSHSAKKATSATSMSFPLARDTLTLSRFAE